MKIPTLPSLPASTNGLLPSISDLVQFFMSSGAHNHRRHSGHCQSCPFVHHLHRTSIPPPPDTDNPLIPLSPITSEPSTGVLPIQPSAIPALSSLVSDYLSSVHHPISITSPFRLSNHSPARNSLCLILGLRFWRNVTIKGMKIHDSGTTILANGVVHARIAMPSGIDGTLYVGRMLPDGLIFDGPLPTAFTPTPIITTPSIIKDSDTKNPDDDADDMPPAPPLPSPPPPHAFVRVRPNT